MMIPDIKISKNLHTTLCEKYFKLVKNKIILNLLLSAVSIIIVYPDVIFGYRTLDPSSYYKNSSITEELIYGKDAKKPPSLHVELSTAVFYEKPINKYIGDSFKRFEFPFWNPNNALGIPIVEQYSTRIFYPLQVLENIIALEDTTTFQLIRIFITIFFILSSFEKLFSINLYEKLLIGVYIASSAIFTWFIGLEQLQNAAVSASILLFTSITYGYISKNSIIINGISIGLLHLSGQPECAFYILLFIFVIVPFINREDNGVLDKIKAIYGYCLSNIIGILITLFQIIPFLDAITSGNITNELHGLSGGAGMASPSPLTLLRLYIYPSLSTYPRDLVFYPINGHWDAVGFFISAPIIFIYILSITIGHKNFINKNVIYLGHASLLYLIIITLKNFGIFPFYQLGNLPLFNLVWSQRWGNISLMLATSIIIFISTIRLRNFGNIKKLNKISTLFILIIFTFLFIDSFNIIPKEQNIPGLTYDGINTFKGDVEKNIFGPAIVAILGIILSTLLLFTNINEIKLKKIYIIAVLILVIQVPRNIPDNIQFYLYFFIIIIVIYILISKTIVLKLTIKSIVATIVLLLFFSPHIVGNENNTDLTEALKLVETKNRVYVEDINFYGNGSSSYSIRTLNGIFSLPISKVDKYLSSYDKRELSSKNQPPWYSAPLQYKEYDGKILLSKEYKLDIPVLIENSIEWLICVTDACNKHKFIKQIGKYKIYKFDKFESRISTQPSNNIPDFIDKGSTILIEGCFSEDDKIIIKDAWYPGWTSEFEGDALETGPYNSIYRYIKIDKSLCGTIKHSYLPKYFYFSVLISVLFILYLLALAKRK